MIFSIKIDYSLSNTIVNKVLSTSPLYSTKTNYFDSDSSRVSFGLTLGSIPAVVSAASICYNTLVLVLRLPMVTDPLV